MPGTDSRLTRLAEKARNGGRCVQLLGDLADVDACLTELRQAGRLDGAEILREPDFAAVFYPNGGCLAFANLRQGPDGNLQVVL